MVREATKRPLDSSGSVKFFVRELVKRQKIALTPGLFYIAQTLVIPSSKVPPFDRSAILSCRQAKCETNAYIRKQLFQYARRIQAVIRRRSPDEGVEAALAAV
jgi:hypothetical protein